MNAYRREKWKTDPRYKNHSKAYREKYPERVKEQSRRHIKHVDPEVKAARKAERAKAAAERAAIRKAEKQAIRNAKLAEQKKATLARQERRKALKAQKSAETQARLAAKYAAMKKAREERKAAEKAAKAAARKAASEARRHQRNEERKANRKANRKRRETNRIKLAHQHGTGPGDYDRCRKNNNGVACAPCKAGAAKYSREKFHSDPKYKEAEQRWRQANPHKVYRDHKDRALKNGGKHEYYTRQHIFDRDGYDCYICNTPVDLTAPHVQGQPGWETYPHIEHVKPLSKGGDDTLANVKIAHAVCNIRKGAQFDEATATV